MNEAELRLRALELAVGSSTAPGLPFEMIVARAEAYFNFLKGQTNNG